MTVKSSTGFRNHVLAVGSVKDALDGSELKLYGGAVPADADAAESGALLATITVNNSGTAVTFAATAESGVLAKNDTEIWSGLVTTGGTCTHYRLVSPTDSGNASSTEVRVQGSVGKIGADLNVSDNVLVGAAIQNIDYFVVALPAG